MWEIDLLGQCVTGLYAVAVGFCFALFYDAFKAVRKCVYCSNLTVFIQDIVISLVLTLFTFLLLIARCNGEVRVYVFIFELIGFLLYRLIFSRYILKIIVKIVKLFVKFSQLYTIKISQLSSFIVLLCGKFSKFLKKVIKNVLQKEKTLENT